MWRRFDMCEVEVDLNVLVRGGVREPTADLVAFDVDKLVLWYKLSRLVESLMLGGGGCSQPSPMLLELCSFPISYWWFRCSFFTVSPFLNFWPHFRHRFLSGQCPWKT